MSDVPNQRIMGELMTGFLSNDKAMGALGSVYQIMASRPGLYANIHAKRKRIKAGSKRR